MRPVSRSKVAPRFSGGREAELARKVALQGERAHAGERGRRPPPRARGPAAPPRGRSLRSQGRRRSRCPRRSSRRPCSGRGGEAARGRRRARPAPAPGSTRRARTRSRRAPKASGGRDRLEPGSADEDDDPGRRPEDAHQRRGPASGGGPRAPWRPEAEQGRSRACSTRKMRPIASSATPASFLAKTGRSSNCAYPAATKSDVQEDDAEEHPVAQDVAVAPGARARRSSARTGSGTNASMPTKTRNVAASTRKSTVKLVGFRSSRSGRRRGRRGRSRGSASRAGARRRRGGAAAASARRGAPTGSARSRALPTPATALARKACHGSVMSG